MITFPSPNISKLDLSGKDLQQFPLEVLELKNLKKLNLSNNRIDKIPKEIIQLKRLETLDLSNNRIINFYAKICELENLKILNLNKNRIKTIPKQVHKLQSLRVLQISDNSLTEFPKEMSKLVRLESLNIANNPLSDFPNFVLELSNLKRLWLNNLPLKTFPSDKILADLKNLECIYCYGQIPNKNIVSLDYLRFAKLKGNCLSDMFLFKNEKKSIPIKSEVKKSDVIKRNKIFISYSHKDDVWLRKVQDNLKFLKHNGFQFSVWDDTKLRGGNKWKQEIDKALNESGIAILIISMDFLGSDFIRNNELPPILRNAEENGTVILPIIVRPCLFTKDKNLSDFQAVNEPKRPLSTLSEAEAEKELVNLTEQIYDLLIP